MFLLAFLASCVPGAFASLKRIPAEIKASGIFGYLTLSDRQRLAQTATEYRGLSSSLTYLNDDDSKRYLQDEAFRAECDALLPLGGLVRLTVTPKMNIMGGMSSTELLFAYLDHPSSHRLASLRFEASYFLSGEEWNENQDQLFASLAQKPNLRMLELVNVDWYITGRANPAVSDKKLNVAALAQLKSLIKLKIHGFKSDDYSGLVGLRNLEKLTLECSSMTHLPHGLSTQLKVVELISNFNLEDISGLSHLPHLTVLKLGHFAGNTLPRMEALERLTLSAFLRGGPIEWFNPDELRNTPNLKELDWLVPATLMTGNNPRHVLRDLDRSLVTLDFINLLPKLEALKLRYATIQEAAEIMERAPLNLILVDCDVSALAFSQLRLLRHGSRQHNCLRKFHACKAK